MDLPVTITANIRGLGEMKELSNALTQIANSSKITKASLASLSAPFRAALTSVAPLRNQAMLAREGLQALSGEAANAQGKVRSVPPAVNQLVASLDKLASGGNVATSTLRRQAQAAYEAAAPYKRLQAAIGFFNEAFEAQKATAANATASMHATKAGLTDLELVFAKINATIGLSNSQIFQMVTPLKEAATAMAPVMSGTEAASLGFERFKEATATATAGIHAVPPAVNTLIGTLMKLADHGEVNIGKLLTLAETAEVATRSFTPLHNVIVMLTDVLKKQAIATGEVATQAKAAAAGGQRFASQTYKMSEALMVSQSAAHGLMLGMGALRGSILQVAFSIIFLRFSNVHLSLAVGATIIAVGGLIKAFTSLVKRSYAAASAIENLDRSLRAYTGSADEANEMMKAITDTSLHFGIAQEEVIKAFQTLREAGIANVEMLSTVGIYARATGKTFSEAANEIAQAIEGNVDSLSLLSATQKRAIELTWEFKNVNARAAWVVNQISENYGKFGKTAAKTTSELRATIKEGFGAIFRVIGVGFNAVFKPLLRGLAWLATVWGNAMNALSRNTGAAITVAITVLTAFAFVVMKVVVVLKKLWIAVWGIIKEMPTFILAIANGAKTLITQLAPALGLSAVQTDKLTAAVGRLAAALPVAGAAASATATQVAAAGTAMTGTTLATTAAASAITARLATMGVATTGATAAVGGLGVKLGGLLGIFGKIFPFLMGVPLVIQGITEKTDKMNKALRITFGVISIVAGVLVAVGTLGAGTGIAIAAVSAGLGMIIPAARDASKASSELSGQMDQTTRSINAQGTAIGHSPGLAEDLTRLATRMSVAEVQTVEWKEKLKALTSQLHVTRREASELGGIRMPTLPAVADVSDFLESLRSLGEGIGTWLWEHIGNPVKTFFKETLSEKLKEIGEWLWDNIGEPIKNFFTKTFPSKLKQIKTWLEEHIVDPIVNFFTVTFPSKLRQIKRWLEENIVEPVVHFFSVTMPAKLGAIRTWLEENIVSPVLHFFAVTMPAKLAGIRGWLEEHISDPVRNFFRNTFPTKLAGIKDWLEESIVDPVRNFFRVTFPAKLTNLKTWLNEAIVDPIKEWIDDLTQVGTNITNAFASHILNPILNFIEELSGINIRFPSVPSGPSHTPGATEEEEDWQEEEDEEPPQVDVDVDHDDEEPAPSPPAPSPPVLPPWEPPDPYDIPYYGPFIPAQKGLIAKRPIRALIGEAGPEAIIPLSKLGTLNPLTIQINITGNWIMDDGTVRKLTDKVTAAVTHAINRYRPMPVTSV